MTDTRDNFPEHYTFLQRYGYEPLPKPMRTGEISGDLRREVWDDIYDFLKQNSLRGPTIQCFTGNASNLLVTVFGKFHKKPKSQINYDFKATYNFCELIITAGKAHDTINFIEIMVNERGSDGFAPRIRRLFEKHSAPYYLDTSKKPYWFVQSASREQGESTEQAIESLHENKMNGAATHLREAAKHMNAEQYADSIVDSIHAVESVACTICPESKTLGAALKSLGKAGILKHPALKQAFEKLYGYTNDEQGIRHALTEQDAPDVGLDEAIFMFGACASFAAYLAQKHRQQVGKR